MLQLLEMEAIWDSFDWQNSKHIQLQEHFRWKKKSANFEAGKLQPFGGVKDSFVISGVFQ